MICLTEIKKDFSDMDKCLRQNADQLRAYCLCNNQNIARGISTVGTFWIFTEYDIKGENFIVSEPLEILQEKPFKLIILEDLAEAFFGKFIAFLYSGKFEKYIIRKKKNY